VIPPTNRIAVDIANESYTRFPLDPATGTHVHRQQRQPPQPTRSLPAHEGIWVDPGVISWPIVLQFGLGGVGLQAQEESLSIAPVLQVFVFRAIEEL
jgi:hypothetical protein